MRYLVVREETCPECKGSKTVRYPTMAWGDDGNFTSFGHLDAPCVTCNGTGVTRSEVELVEALRELGLVAKEWW